MIGGLRGGDVLDQLALVSLLSVGEHVRSNRNVDRATGVAGCVDQSRRSVGLVRPQAVIGSFCDWNEDQGQAETEDAARAQGAGSLQFLERLSSRKKYGKLARNGFRVLSLWKMPDILKGDALEWARELLV